MSSEARQRAWMTRREKYGQRGHSKTAYGWRQRGPVSKEDLGVIVGKLSRNELSEGQASRASGLSRIELRRLVDERSEP
jgi:hypothetical protein